MQARRFQTGSTMLSLPLVYGFRDRTRFHFDVRRWNLEIWNLKFSMERSETWNGLSNFIQSSWKYTWKVARGSFAYSSVTDASSCTAFRSECHWLSNMKDRVWKCCTSSMIGIYMRSASIALTILERNAMADLTFQEEEEDEPLSLPFTLVVG